MQKNSIYLTSLILALAVSPNKSNASVDFQNYTPTLDKEKISGAESAYVLIYEKTDEANADFSTYEKLTNGDWSKVYYKYSTSIKSGVVSTPIVQNMMQTKESVNGHFINNTE
ncbi:MAG: hypothetical protein ACK5N8_07460 [Alphaproteobacteria bacterium]